MKDAPEVTDEPRRHPLVWIVYLLLYAVAIPWYWPTGYRGALILGLPVWAAVSLAAVAVMAVWTAFVIHRWWRE
jgi:hypothetical protein